MFRAAKILSRLSGKLVAPKNWQTLAILGASVQKALVDSLMLYETGMAQRPRVEYTT